MFIIKIIIQIKSCIIPKTLGFASIFALSGQLVSPFLKGVSFRIRIFYKIISRCINSQFPKGCHIVGIAVMPKFIVIINTCSQPKNLPFHFFSSNDNLCCVMAIHRSIWSIVYLYTLYGFCVQRRQKSIKLVRAYFDFFFVKNDLYFITSQNFQPVGIADIWRKFYNFRNILFLLQHCP